jgi:hypothetical protein
MILLDEHRVDTVLPDRERVDATAPGVNALSGVGLLGIVIKP